MEEKTLGLSFELTVRETKGLMSVAVPAVVSGALLRKISMERPRTRGQMRSAAFTEQLRRKLQRCPFHFHLQVEEVRCSASALASLSVGKVVELKRSADGLGQFVCQGQPMFSARIARADNRRAAQIMQVRSIERGDPHS